jgi:hypothetical protein
MPATAHATVHVRVGCAHQCGRSSHVGTHARAQGLWFVAAGLAPFAAGSIGCYSCCAGCLVCCNVHRSMQQIECNPACLQQAVSTPAAQSRPVCMAVRALAGGRDRRHKVHCGHVGPRGLPFESALAGGVDLARIGLAPIVPTAPMVPQTTAPQRAVAAQGVHTRHNEIQPRPLPGGCEHRPAHRQPHTAPLTCRPTVLCAVASQPCGLCGSVGSQVGNIVSACCAGRRRITSTTSSARSRTVRCSTRTGPCCAVRVLVVLLGATEQSAPLSRLRIVLQSPTKGP